MVLIVVLAMTLVMVNPAPVVPTPVVAAAPVVMVCVVHCSRRNGASDHSADHSGSGHVPHHPWRASRKDYEAGRGHYEEHHFYGLGHGSPPAQVIKQRPGQTGRHR